MGLNSRVFTVSLLRWDKNFNNVEDETPANSFIESQNLITYLIKKIWLQEKAQIVQLVSY